MAIQFNYLADRDAFVEQANGTFSVDMGKIRAAVRDLTHDLLTIEATGDYEGARRLMDTLGIVRPNMRRALQKMQGIPTDIEPLFITADEVTGRTPVAIIDPTPVPKAKQAKVAAQKPATSKLPAERATTGRKSKAGKTPLSARNIQADGQTVGEKKPARGRKTAAKTTSKAKEDSSGRTARRSSKKPTASAEGLERHPMAEWARKAGGLFALYPLLALGFPIDLLKRLVHAPHVAEMSELRPTSMNFRIFLRLKAGGKGGPATHGKRTSIAWKAEELCHIRNVPSRPLAFDFQRPFAGIATQER
jgi:hypothetical protein